MIEQRVFIRQALIVLGLFGFATSLCAVTGAVQAKPKYAVVDMQEVILNVSDGKSARANLEKEIKGKEKQFMNQKKELDKLNEEWKSQAALLSESARMKKQQEFQQKFLSLKNAEMSFQAEIKRKEAKATQDIAIKIAKLVEGMASGRGFEAVFETNTAGLLYLKNPVNLTGEVIQAYEKAHGKKGAVAKKGKK